MSTTTANSYYNSYFRRRRIGRASSPPTWACYEQIHQYDDDSDRSVSSDEEEGTRSLSASDDEDESSEDGILVTGANAEEVRGRETQTRMAYPEDSDSSLDTQNVPRLGAGGIESDDIDMDMGDGSGNAETGEDRHDLPPQPKKDVKGKQKAVEPFSESEHDSRKQKKERIAKKASKRHERRAQQGYALRPILTIQKSQGFVWNQDLFVPPYIKDRYIASTSPPNSRGFVSTSASSTNSALTDYDTVEVVEIRIREGEINHIIP